jgi:hypothetical protein
MQYTFILCYNVKKLLVTAFFLTSTATRQEIFQVLARQVVPAYPLLIHVLSQVKFVRNLKPNLFNMHFNVIFFYIYRNCIGFFELSCQVSRTFFHFFPPTSKFICS